MFILKQKLTSTVGKIEKHMHNCQCIVLLLYHYFQFSFMNSTLTFDNHIPVSFQLQTFTFELNYELL